MIIKKATSIKTKPKFMRKNKQINEYFTATNR